MQEQLLNKDDIDEIIAEASERIIEDVSDLNNFAVIGIQTRGVELARRIRQKLHELSGSEIKSGTLDITFHRDDLATRGVLPLIKETKIEIDITGMVILLVDDVLFTGRTIKAALETLTTFGRPQIIRLFTLVDRANRELPIQPDYCGYTVETSIKDKVRVRLNEIDSVDDAVYMERL